MDCWSNAFIDHRYLGWVCYAMTADWCCRFWPNWSAAGQNRLDEIDLRRILGLVCLSDAILGKYHHQFWQLDLANLGSIAVQIFYMVNDLKPGVDDRQIVALGVAERVLLFPLYAQSQNRCPLSNWVPLQSVCVGKHRLGGLAGSSSDMLESCFDCEHLVQQSVARSVVC
jgi:hypothetical protein